MSDQSRKHSIGLAGEFLVAGELLRRGVMAAVTYGNAKKADVVALNGARAVTIEVKSTSEPKWVLGGTVPEAEGNFRALVYLPQDASLPPEYYILSSAELHELVMPGHLRYLESYRLRHGREFSGKGVVSVLCEHVKEHQSAWAKIVAAVGT